MIAKTDTELSVSFGYQCNVKKGLFYDPSEEIESSSRTVTEAIRIKRNASSLSFLSGAALSANATLANTSICNGVIGSEILPGLDSPVSFRRIPSSPSLSRMDMLSTSFQSCRSTSTDALSISSQSSDWNLTSLKSMSAPSPSKGFLNSMEVEIAGGAAGEDRVQAVCSEENGWFFCAIYDGFNGRDAADFLAVTLYDNFMFYLNQHDEKASQQNNFTAQNLIDNDFDEMSSMEGQNERVRKCSSRHKVLESLEQALVQVEDDFLHMVEQEMDDRPDLVCIGCCVLVAFLYDEDLYILNLGDSRAVLATNEGVNKTLQCIQLTDIHSVDNDEERARLLSEHPDDPKTILGGRVKGKLRVTRAFGVGYLKKRNMNDALMGILKVQNLKSPPYVSTQPSLHVHQVSKDDQFVIIASDGLYDFFSNEEAVILVHSYILRNPSGDPAKYLLEQLVSRAAANAGFSTDELLKVPMGRRRKYHDDVTVIVIILGSNQRTATASTSL